MTCVHKNTKRFRLATYEIAEQLSQQCERRGCNVNERFVGTLPTWHKFCYKTAASVWGWFYWALSIALEVDRP